ncbi:hypothetical protein D4R87_00680, partial [bacterium]
KIVGYAMEAESFENKNTSEILVFVNVGYYVSGEDFQKIDKIDELEKNNQSLEQRISALENK